MRSKCILILTDSRTRATFLNLNAAQAQKLTRNITCKCRRRHT